MTRRSLVATGAFAPLAAAAGSAPKQAMIEMYVFRLRNDAGNQRRRAAEFLSAYVPALRRAGAGPVGAFSSNIGEGTPYLMLLVSYPGWAELDAVNSKLGADAEARSAVDQWHAGGVPYVRVEGSLLRAFDSFPAVVPPKAEGGARGRIFELRTYESQNYNTLRGKIAMFGNGEIDIFKNVGMQPVFFGETVYGRNMPNLTYMLAHDDMAARDKSWAAFGQHPEWRKMMADPKLSDASLVTNISVALLSALPFSDIR